MIATRLAVAATLTAYLGACTTLQPLPESAGPPSAAIHVGDTVRITTRDGQPHELRITSVSPESVCGAAACIDTREVASVERQEIDPLKTTLLVVGVAALVALIVAAAQAAGAAAVMGSFQ
jgi:hypothetical protein